MTVKTGDYIEFPKGTPVWNDSYFNDFPAPSGRKMVVEAIKVHTVTIYQHDDIQSYRCRVVPADGYPVRRGLNRPEGRTIHCFRAKSVKVSDYATEAEARAAWPSGLDRLEEWLTEWRAWDSEVKSCVIVEQGDFVEFGKNRYVRLADVKIVAAPEPKKEKVTKVTNQQLMIPKSVWKTDTEILLYLYSFGFNATSGQYESKKTMLVPIPAGTEFTITGKAEKKHHPNDASDSMFAHMQLAFPIEYVAADGCKHTAWAFYKLIEHSVMVKGPDTIPEFVLLDTATNKFYAGNPYGYDISKQMWTNSDLAYSDRYTKAKKFKRLSDVRAHLLIQSGYYDNLPESWGSVPEWMSQSKNFDVPDTWVIVKYDKLTKLELERIEAIDTFKRAWRLRELTVNYGSAVRKLYSDLDKKGDLDNWSAAMFFVNKDEDAKWNSVWYEEFTDEQKKSFKDLAKQFDNNTTKLVLSNTSAAIAIKDVETAVMLKLSMSDSNNWLVVDFKTMSTIVEETNV